MATPTLTVQLREAVSGDTIVFKAPAPDTPAPVTVPGVVHRAAGGSIRHYQMGQHFWETTLKVQAASNTLKNSMEAFFRNHATADLTYTDENGNTFTAQWIDTVFPLQKDYRGSWSGSIKLNLSAVLK